MRTKIHNPENLTHALGVYKRGKDQWYSDALHTKINLDPGVLQGFVLKYLLEEYDAPAPIPDFHPLLWDLCCLDDQYAAFAAPRGHAKSTGVTHTYGLATVLFRINDFILIVSDTEAQAAMFLADIRREFTENPKIAKDFNFVGFTKETSTELELAFADGHHVKYWAKGAEQRCRGMKWRNKRPNLILCDDMEGDEQVESEYRRRKLRSWFFNTLLPAGAEYCRVRVGGTVMHFDSLLFRLLKDEGWSSWSFKAHDPGFKDILWTPKFPKERLLAIREGYKRQGNLSGYSREYLNHPMDEDSAFFKKEDLQPISKEMLPKQLTYYAAMDLAISVKAQANFTAIVVIGVDEDNYMYVVHARKGRWDAFQIMENLFGVHVKYYPEMFIIEKGTIYEAIKPILMTETQNRKLYPLIHPVVAIHDKASRARPIQFRTRAKSVYVVDDEPWTADFRTEILQFSVDRDGLDDWVDAFAWIGRVLQKLIAFPGEDSRAAYEKDMDEEQGSSSYHMFKGTGRSTLTGY